MTVDAVPAAIVPFRPAWHGLLWTVPFAVLWGWLIYQLPTLVDGGFPAMAARLMSYGLIALGLRLGLENTDLSRRQRRTIWLVLMVPFTLWATAAWTAAIDGVFRAGTTPLPLLPAAMLLPVIVGTPFLLLSKRVGQLLDAMPATWLVALQFYRVLGVQWLSGWLRGVQPGIWALPAGTGDALTGIFAVSAAIAVATGTDRGRRAAIFWNIFGLVDFAIAIPLGLITSPGPFQLIVPGTSIVVDAFPNVLTPAFVVPSSILLHVLSIRQLLRRGRTEATRQSPPAALTTAH